MVGFIPFSCTAYCSEKRNEKIKTRKDKSWKSPEGFVSLTAATKIVTRNKWQIGDTVQNI